MKICMLSSSTGWGGLERNLVRYASWMGELGHEVELNCVPESPLANAVLNHPISIRFIQRQRRYYPWKEARELRKHLRKNAFEFLWIRDPRDLSLCSAAVRRTSTRFIFHQGMQILQPKRSPLHFIRFQPIDAWVAPLMQLQEQTLQNTPISNDKIHVIPLGLEDDWFDERTHSRAEARASLGLPEDAKIAGLFGRIDSLKGQETLIHALKRTKEEHWHALFIGENTPNEKGDERQRLKLVIEKLQLSHRVHWRPPSEDLKTAYDSCDAYTMCSDSETIGMVTLEAMARKLPVAGTQSGGTPELLDFGKMGRLFEPGHSGQLAELLDDLSSWPVASDGYLKPFRKSEVNKKWSLLLQHLRKSAS